MDQVATLEYKWSEQFGVFVALVKTPHGTAEFPVPSTVGGIAQLPAGETYGIFIPNPENHISTPVEEGGG